MPAKSKAQQRFMGMVHAYKKGELKGSEVSKAIKKAAKGMKKKTAKDYASTKHTDKPERVKSEAKERDYKAEYKKFQSSTKSKKYRAELNKYNRQKGTYGNGDGKDASHKGGKIAGFEKESTNRGRREKSRLKKETVNEAGLEMNKLKDAIKMFQKKIKKQGRVTNARDEEHLKNLIKVYKQMGGKGVKESVSEDHIKFSKEEMAQLHKDGKIEKGGHTIEFRESVNEGKKRFKVGFNIGKAKYVISHHDGREKHKDGSDFFGISIYKNQKAFEKGQEDLKKKGYIEESVNESHKFTVKYKKKDGDDYYLKLVDVSANNIKDAVRKALSKIKSKEEKVIVTVSQDTKKDYVAEGKNRYWKAVNRSKRELYFLLSIAKKEGSLGKKGSKELADVIKSLGNLEKYFYQEKTESVSEGFEKYHLGNVGDSKLKNRLERAIKIWGGKVDAVGMDTIKFRLSSSDVMKFPALLKKLDRNKNVWIGDKRKNNVYDRKQNINKLGEAISKEEWQKYVKYGRALKKYMTKLLKIPLKARVIKQAGPNPWIEIRVAKFGKDIIPNDLRLKAAKVIGATSIRDKSNVNYGNIRSNSISLKHGDWVKLLKNKVKESIANKDCCDNCRHGKECCSN